MTSLWQTRLKMLLVLKAGCLKDSTNYDNPAKSLEILRATKFYQRLPGSYDQVHHNKQQKWDKLWQTVLPQPKSRKIWIQGVCIRKDAANCASWSKKYSNSKHPNDPIQRCTFMTFEWLKKSHRQIVMLVGLWSL